MVMASGSGIAEGINQSSGLDINANGHLSNKGLNNSWF